jgi:hypothetical protein
MRLRPATTASSRRAHFECSPLVCSMPLLLHRGRHTVALSAPLIRRRLNLHLLRPRQHFMRGRVHARRRLARHAPARGACQLMRAAGARRCSTCATRRRRRATT